MPSKDKKPSQDKKLAAQRTGREKGRLGAKLARWRSDFAGASQEAWASGEVQTTMTRTFYLLGAALAAVAGFGVANLFRAVH